MIAHPSSSGAAVNGLPIAQAYTTRAGIAFTAA
jgi:hypothetical protein